jgi:hypothetical protein
MIFALSSALAGSGPAPSIAAMASASYAAILHDLFMGFLLIYEPV